MKYFRMSYEEIVFRRSYINILLLNRSIPSFDLDNDKDDGSKEKTCKVERKSAEDQHPSDFFMGLM